MANLIYDTSSTPIVFADVTDFSGTASGYTRTAQIDLTSIASAAARQSDKVDLGVDRSQIYSVRVGIELDVAPTAGNLVEFYWSASASGTAGTGNDGGASGADGAYQAGSEAEWKKQLIFLGALVCTNDAATTVQVQSIGMFKPPERYGQVVVVNTSGQALEGDAVEMFVALVPITPEIQ